MARAGENPLAERRRERRTVPTFKEAATQVHAAHSATFKNAKHKAQWLASLEADVFPAIGDRPVNAIDSARHPEGALARSGRRSPKPRGG